ncbi:MAG: TPM domain-containing protein [Alphaproteobacteria bacterium]|nr:TPM domain-containing protein [Alphaproteobacteria bacterium]
MRQILIALCFAAMGAAAQQPAESFQIPLQPPGDREFIADYANLIDTADEEKIRAVADKLLTERAIPIVVVTISSMANAGMPGMRIETFANILFDQWGIGYEQIQNESWNRGILLLVSQGDRKARIELGADWAHSYDATASQIMDGVIVPAFKQGTFSAGIAAGTEALDKMARDIPLPKTFTRGGAGGTAAQPQWWHYAIMAGIVGLMIFTFISLIRRGSSGWAWLFWGAVFSILGIILYNALRNSGSSGNFGGGGFSGGSFGGGFSGGGGATGSW